MNLVTDGESYEHVCNKISFFIEIINNKGTFNIVSHYDSTQTQTLTVA